MNFLPLQDQNLCKIKNFWHFNLQHYWGIRNVALLSHVTTTSMNTSTRISKTLPLRTKTPSKIEICACLIFSSYQQPALQRDGNPNINLQQEILHYRHPKPQSTQSDNNLNTSTWRVETLKKVPQDTVWGSEHTTRPLQAGDEQLVQGCRIAKGILWCSASDQLEESFDIVWWIICKFAQVSTLATC